MRRSICFAMIILLTSLPGAMAQDTCFCLRDLHENWLRDCREIKSGIAPVKIICHDPNKRQDDSQTEQWAHRTQMPSMAGWTRVEEGQQGCTPCVYQDPSRRC